MIIQGVVHILESIEEIFRYLLSNQRIDTLTFMAIPCVIFFIIIGLICFLELGYSFRNGLIYNRNRLFGMYMPGAGVQGEYLKPISINKEFILINDDFFEGIYRHKRLYSKALPAYKSNWLYKKELEYNIVIIARCGEYSTKFINIIDYCIYYNLPICRIIDAKPSEFKKCIDNISDDLSITYYMREQSDE